jgi:uncharacterized low-complexity protein
VRSYTLLTDTEQTFVNAFINYLFINLGGLHMTKTKLISSLGGAVAVSLLAAPTAQASENPFAMQKVTNATQLAESMEKGAEGKCGEGKCGDKSKEGGCSGKMEKSKDGQCGDKMKEGGCNGKMEAPEG